MPDTGRTLTLKFLWMLYNRRNFLMEFGSTFQPEFFGSHEAQYLAKLALEYWAEHGTQLPISGAYDRLDSDEDEGQLEQEKVTVEVVEQLIDHFEPVPKSDTDYIYTAARDFVKRQTLGFALKEALSTLDGGTPEEALKVVDKAKLIIEPRPTRMLSLIKDAPSIMRRLGIREDDENHFSTGLMKLDKAIGGGLRPGELAALIAPTGRGKTMWLCSVAAKAFFFGAEVVYYTLEVDQDEIAKRTLASLSGVSMNEITMWATFKTSPEMEEDDEEDDTEFDEHGMPRRRRVSKKKSDLNVAEKINMAFKNVRRVGGKDRDIHVVDLPTAAVSTLAADIERRQREGEHPKLILIDYADRLTAQGRFEKKVDAEQQIFRDLMAMAKEYDVAIWTALQGNRQSLGKARLDLQHIAGAYSKAWEATYVVAAGQSDAMRDANMFTFGMSKVRRTVSAATGDQFRVFYDFSKAQFLDWANPDNSDGETAAALTHYGYWDDDAEEETDDKKALGAGRRGKSKFPS